MWKLRRLLHVGPGGEVRIGNQGCTLRRCGAVISGVRQVFQSRGGSFGGYGVEYMESADK